nr:basic proline-rich protein-like [Dasypus novemcinctus]XP_058142203.1 basic proline-rich protein-like [Dasypus novemcinctus]
MVPPTSKAKHYPLLPPAERGTLGARATARLQAVRAGKRLCPHVPRTQRALRTGFGWRAEEDLKGLPEGKLPSVKHRTVLPPPPLPKPVWEGAAPGPEPPPGGFCPGEVELSGASPTLALGRLPASRVGPEAAPQARSQTAASRGSRSAGDRDAVSGARDPGREREGLPAGLPRCGRVYQQVFPAAAGTGPRPRLPPCLPTPPPPPAPPSLVPFSAPPIPTPYPNSPCSEGFPGGEAN